VEGKNWAKGQVAGGYNYSCYSFRLSCLIGENSIRKEGIKKKEAGSHTLGGVRRGDVSRQQPHDYDLGLTGKEEKLRGLGVAGIRKQLPRSLGTNKGIISSGESRKKKKKKKKALGRGITYGRRHGRQTNVSQIRHEYVSKRLVGRKEKDTLEKVLAEKEKNGFPQGRSITGARSTVLSFTSA